MIHWFTAIAPIRVKFKVLLALHCLWSIVFLAALMVAANGATIMAFSIAGLAFAATAATVIISGKLISDPYVTTVVRMEALADGNIEDTIQFTHHADCVGRMTKAMAVFRRNAEVVKAAGRVQEIVVEGLGTGMTELADGICAPQNRL
jgi:methyl-accepting chemotaxis protein